MSLKNEAEASELIDYLKQENIKINNTNKNKDDLVNKLEENINIIKNKYNLDFENNLDEVQKLKIKISEAEFECNKFKQENND